MHIPPPQSNSLSGLQPVEIVPIYFLTLSFVIKFQRKKKNTIARRFVGRVVAFSGTTTLQMTRNTFAVITAELIRSAGGWRAITFVGSIWAIAIPVTLPSVN
jgi:hypothetical protein